MGALKAFVIGMLVINILRLVGGIDAIASFGRQWWYVKPAMAHIVVDLVIVAWATWLLTSWGRIELAQQVEAYCVGQSCFDAVDTDDLVFPRGRPR